MNMKKGEVASVTIHPEYGFGSSDSSQDMAVVPANSVVTYDVELISFVKVTKTFSRHIPSAIVDCVEAERDLLGPGKGIVGYEHTGED